MYRRTSYPGLISRLLLVTSIVMLSGVRDASAQRSRRADSITTVFIGSVGPGDRWPYGNPEAMGTLADSVRYPFNIDTAFGFNATARGYWDYDHYRPAPPSVVLGGINEPSYEGMIIEPVQLYSAFSDAAYIRFEFERHERLPDSIEYPGFIDHAGLTGINDSTDGTAPAFLTGTKQATSSRCLRLRSGIDPPGVFADSIWHVCFVNSSLYSPVYYFRGNEQLKLLLRIRARLDSLRSDVARNAEVFRLTLTEWTYRSKGFDSALVTRSFIITADSAFKHAGSDFDTIDLRFRRLPQTEAISFRFEWPGTFSTTFDYIEAMTAHVDTTDNWDSIRLNGYADIRHGEAAANSGEDFVGRNPTALTALVDRIVRDYSPNDSSHYINFVRIGDEFGLGQALPFKRLVKLMRDRSHGRVEIVPYVHDSSVSKWNFGYCDYCGMGYYIGYKLGQPEQQPYMFEGARLGWVDSALYADPRAIFVDPAVVGEGVPLPKRTVASRDSDLVRWEAHQASTGATDDNGWHDTPSAYHYTRQRYMERYQHCIVPQYLIALRTTHRLSQRNSYLHASFGTIWYAGMSQTLFDSYDHSRHWLGYAACLRPPTAPELKVTGHLSVSCGSQGLLLYFLSNYPDSVPYGVNGGIMKSNGDYSSQIDTCSVPAPDGSRIVSPMWFGYRERADTLKTTLVRLLRTYGNVLLHSRYIGDWTASQFAWMPEQTRLGLPFVPSSIQTYDDRLLRDALVPDNPGGLLDSANRTFVHVSEWVDTLSASRDTLLYITNLRTDDSYGDTPQPSTLDRRMITMQLRADHHLVDDADENRVIAYRRGVIRNADVDAGDSLRVWLLPGDGVLVRLQSPLPASSRNTAARAVTMTSQPNPFSNHLSIHLALPSSTTVNLAVFNVLGAEVARIDDHEPMLVGSYEIEWSPQGLASGTCFLRLEAGTDAITVPVVYVP